MALANQAVREILQVRERFNRSTAKLTEAISEFAPAEGMMTAAQQVAHCARVIDWFLEGAFRPEGFDLNFEKQIEQVLAVKSLASARSWFDASIQAALEKLASCTDEELAIPLPAGPIMSGMPTFDIVSAIVDHTAHHRGALTTYARANGIVPPDPFTD